MEPPPSSKTTAGQGFTQSAVPWTNRAKASATCSRRIDSAQSDPNPRPKLKSLSSGGAHAPRMSWSAPPPTTSRHPGHFLWSERKQSARAPTATREGAYAPQRRESCFLGEDRFDRLPLTWTVKRFSTGLARHSEGEVGHRLFAGSPAAPCQKKTTIPLFAKTLSINWVYIDNQAKIH